MNSILMTHPSASGARDFYFTSVAHDWARAHSDPPQAGKYWRSVIGNLGLTAEAVARRRDPTASKRSTEARRQAGLRHIRAVARQGPRRDSQSRIAGLQPEPARQGPQRDCQSRSRCSRGRPATVGSPVCSPSRPARAPRRDSQSRIARNP